MIESGEPPLFVLMRRMSVLHLDHLIQLGKARPYFIFSIHSYTKLLLLLWSRGLRRIYGRQRRVSGERKLKTKKQTDACLLFFFERPSYEFCGVFIDPGRRRFSSVVHRCLACRVFFLPPIFAVRLVYRAVVALVRDGGAYPGYRNAHRSAGPAVRTQTC